VDKARNVYEHVASFSVHDRWSAEDQLQLITTCAHDQYFYCLSVYSTKVERGVTKTVYTALKSKEV